MGSHWSDPYASVLEEADGIVLLMDQRPSSVVACKEAAGLCVRLGIPQSRISFVLNRCSRQARVTSCDCALTLGADRVIEVDDGGGEVDECLSMGRPSLLLESSGRFSESVSKLVEELVPGISNERCSGVEKPRQPSGLGILRGILGHGSQGRMAR